MNDKAYNPRNAWISNILTSVITIILGVVLFKAEQLNWITTYESLQYVTGGQMIDGLDWNRLIADAIVILEVASLATIFTPVKALKEEPTILRWIFGLWGGSVIFDAFLTWYFVSVQTENTLIKSPSAIQQYVTTLFPVVVTILLTLVQVGILRIFGAEAEKIADFVRSLKLPHQKQEKTYKNREELHKQWKAEMNDGKQKYKNPNVQRDERGRPKSYQMPEPTTFHDFTKQERWKDD